MVKILSSHASMPGVVVIKIDERLFGATKRNACTDAVCDDIYPPIITFQRTPVDPLFLPSSESDLKRY